MSFECYIDIFGLMVLIENWSVSPVVTRHSCWRATVNAGAISAVLTGRSVDSAQWSQIPRSSESRFLPTPPAFDVPVRGVPVRILPCRLVWKKTIMAWLADSEKLLKMFIHFDRIHGCDRQTDGRTNTQIPRDNIGRACIASRSNSSFPET